MQLTARFHEALLYAAELHAGQVRKVTGVPYLSHLLGVASLVLEHGGSEDAAIAALLHDAIEDQGGDPIRREIRGRFGDRILALVEGCTDADSLPKPPWRPRKEAHLARLRSAQPEVALIFAADKLHNARCLVRDLQSLGPDLWQHFHGGAEGTLWYYRAAAELARDKDVPPALVNELRAAVDQLGRLISAQG
jgi:(p)ppGpp synthase/HD superfamily hydrolase